MTAHWGTHWSWSYICRYILFDMMWGVYTVYTVYIYIYTVVGAFKHVFKFKVSSYFRWYWWDDPPIANANIVRGIAAAMVALASWSNIKSPCHKWQPVGKNIAFNQVESNAMKRSQVFYPSWSCYRKAPTFELEKTSALLPPRKNDRATSQQKKQWFRCWSLEFLGALFAQSCYDSLYYTLWLFNIAMENGP